MADRKAALAELLGEIGLPYEEHVAGGEGYEEVEAGIGTALEMGFGDLDVTTAAPPLLSHRREERAEGDEGEDEEEEEEDDADDMSLISGLDLELIKYADHDVVRNILRSEASDLKDRARSVEAKLQAVEMESISDYVAESDNLLALHAQIQYGPKL
jgi:hypothetical protein